MKKEWPKKIRLIKLETLADAKHPQEEKYPSGVTIGEGILRENVLPKKGVPFALEYAGTSRLFLTSTVQEIVSQDDTGIVFKTNNSIYKIAYI